MYPCSSTAVQGTANPPPPFRVFENVQYRVQTNGGKRHGHSQ